MNIFVPLLIGAVDMAKKKPQDKIHLSSLIKIDILILRTFFSSLKNKSFNQDPQNCKSDINLNSYLAGFSEANGHIWILVLILLKDIILDFV